MTGLDLALALDREREERTIPLGNAKDRELWNAYQARSRRQETENARGDLRNLIASRYQDDHGLCPVCSGYAHWAPADLEPVCDSEDNCAPDAILDALRFDHEDRGSGLVLQWASEVTPELIEWLWTDRLPLHDLAVLAGEPGLGKSTTTTELAARITRGELDGALYGKPRSVLIASAEDHFESVIWGRLKAAGADLSRVASVARITSELTIPGDAEAIAHECRQLRDQSRPVAMIVVDPIAAYLDGVDSHKDAAVRVALAPLANLAQTEGVCVLVVAHLNKSNAGKLLDRISGSGAFGAAPRSVLAFARDPDDPDGEQGVRRVIVHAKSNHGRYAPTLAAHIDAPMVLEVGATVSKLVIDGESDVSPEDLRPDGVRDQSSATDVEERISEALAAGDWRPSLEVKAEVASASGVTRKAVERAGMRMRDRGELETEAFDFPKRTRWRLPQWGRDSGDSPVPTAAVPTDRPQQPQAMQAAEDLSRDAQADTSLLSDPCGHDDAQGTA